MIQIDVDKYLNENGYRYLTKDELNWDIKLLEELFNETSQFTIDIQKFNDDLNVNDKIYRSIIMDLDKNKKKYFLYIKKGFKKALKPEDRKTQLYICYIHKKYPRKFIPIIKYYEYKSKSNQNNNQINNKKSLNDNQMILEF